ncbi:MAG: membrane protein insertase YidC [Sphingobacteriia bacterium]|nr:membrane protein insertase YidC [Sphingobacteriia bacterium]
MNEIRKLITTSVIVLLLIGGWQLFFAKKNNDNLSNKAQEQEIKFTTREHAIQNSIHDRVLINTNKFSGSINLRGAVFDDLILKEFDESIEKNSKKVELLNPINTENAHYIHLGWLSTENSIKVPDNHAIWRTDNKTLAVNHPVVLSWENGQGVTFNTRIEIDENYMFSITHSVHNNMNKPLTIIPYGLISKIEKNVGDSTSILHEGPLGVFDGILQEVSFKNMKDEIKNDYKDNKTGWLGLTDKYWLSSIVPDSRYTFNASFLYKQINQLDRFQVDFIGQRLTVPQDGKLTYNLHLFTGAKKIDLLDQYEKTYNIDNFDRAIDFGWLYFLTKPMSIILNFINSYSHNFGIAILLLTVIIKLIMLPLANKSYTSITKMKELTPVINRLKERYKDDKLRFNYELMQLYKREKINPLSGCLPLLVQIPVFFALYKVLYISIESRHAPFFGWIKDLSAPDPTSIFNVFGLAPWDAPSFLTIGAWPIIMGITMYLQQKMNPEPTDPVQAQMMKFMPVIFVVMFYKFPAGLVIYWAWNNILSILQQWFVQKRVVKEMRRF